MRTRRRSSFATPRNAFGVHPLSGRIFIDDVGGTQFEEINDDIAGANYGWLDTEGYMRPRFR